MWKPPQHLIDRMYADLAVTALKPFKYAEELIMYLAALGKLILSKELTPGELPPHPAAFLKVMGEKPSFWGQYTEGNQWVRRHLEHYIQRACQNAPQAALILMLDEKEAGLPLEETDVSVFKAAYKQVGAELLPIKIEGAEDGKVIHAGDGKQLLTKALALGVLNEAVATANLLLFTDTGLRPDPNFLKSLMPRFAYSQKLIQDLHAIKRHLPLPPEHRVNDMRIIHPDYRHGLQWLPWNLLAEDEGFIVETDGHVCPGCFKARYEAWYCSMVHVHEKGKAVCTSHKDPAVHLICRYCKTQWVVPLKEAKLPPGPTPPQEVDDDADPASTTPNQ